MYVMITANAAWNLWNFRRSLIKALIADGCRITILAPPDGSVDNLIRIGCAFIPLKMDVRGLNPLQDLRLFYRYAKILRNEKPDVVLSFTIKNNIFGAMAANEIGTPFIPTVTGLGTAFLSGALLQSIAEFLYRRAFDRLPVVFFQNEDDRRLFADHSLVANDRATVLPGSGVDLSWFMPANMPGSDEQPVFLMVSRLLRDKGVMEFVEAARQIRVRHPEARFQLLGAAQAQNRSAIDEATVRGWVEEGTIEYLGTASDVRPYIASSQCVVLPSYREGAPRTLIEAAAMARPLIATDVPGCRNVIESGVSGLFCEAGSARSLADGMARFLAMPYEDRKAMGRAGRKKMEREFDETIVVDAYRDAIAVSSRR